MDISSLLSFSLGVFFLYLMGSFIYSTFKFGVTMYNKRSPQAHPTATAQTQRIIDIHELSTSEILTVLRIKNPDTKFIILSKKGPDMKQTYSYLISEN